MPSKISSNPNAKGMVSSYFDRYYCLEMQLQLITEFGVNVHECMQKPIIF
jgi:hypothetical protein